MTTSTVQATKAAARPALPGLGAAPAPLAQQAVDALVAAVQVQTEGTATFVEERSVYRPDSWLIQRCWEVLADAGAVGAALVVARIAAKRQPLALIQCLYRLSRQIEPHIGLAGVVAGELAQLERTLITGTTNQDGAPRREQLLYAATTAANLGDRTLAFACLECLDQCAQPWDRLLVQPDQRSMLADTILRVGLHPLTVALMTHALRRFSDAGAQFVLEIVGASAEQLRRSQSVPRFARMLTLGVETFRNASLTSLHSRRLTATVFGHAGLVDEVLTQLTAIANIQAARRESGLSLRQGDPSLLRQVKRPTADADVDFQVYTLREAIRAMPLRQMTRETRIELANRLAMLGTRSDGWTAAGAATTLVELGAIKFALEVVGKIPASDPTQAEGVIALVRGLLAVNEPALAEEQVQKGLAWARAYPGRNPERALLWGLAEVYLDRRQPEKALALLDQWQDSTTFLSRMRSLFGRTVSDDQLRNDGLRLRALLQQDNIQPRQLQTLVTDLLLWAPRLLEGEALVNFLADDLLKPLLTTGRARLALSLLPALRGALRTGNGEKHAARVAGVAAALATEFARPVGGPPNPSGGNGHAVVAMEAETRQMLEQFIAGIWKDDTQRGLWQTVHGVEGSLPLVLALEGPLAVAAIAQSVAELGVRWPG